MSSTVDKFLKAGMFKLEYEPTKIKEKFEKDVEAQNCQKVKDSVSHLKMLQEIGMVKIWNDFHLPSNVVDVYHYLKAKDAKLVEIFNQPKPKDQLTKEPKFKISFNHMKEKQQMKALQMWLEGMSKVSNPN